MKTYPKFKHESPSVTLEDNFNTLDFNQYESSPSGKAQEVQSSSHVDLMGGDIIERLWMNKL